MGQGVGEGLSEKVTSFEQGPEGEGEPSTGKVFQAAGTASSRALRSQNAW